jgi:glycosyltransferase involved in cell wall biosynthesis
MQIVQKMTEKISVVIPTLNSGRTLEEMLDSLASQIYDNLEVIAVDGGSTDNSLEILSGYPVRILRNDRRGVGAARRAGVDDAKGELVAFLDSDCIAPPDWLSKLYSKTQEHADAAAIGGIAKAKTPSLISKCLEYRLFGIEKGEVDIEVESVATMNAIYHKNAILAVGNFNLEYELAEDPELNRRLRKAGFKLVLSPQVVVFHDHPVTIRELVTKWFRYGEWFSKLYVTEYREFFKKIVPRVLYMTVFVVSILFSMKALYLPVLVLLSPSLVYFRAALKAFYENKDVKFLLALPLVHVIKLQAHSWGVLYGLVRHSLINRFAKTS